MAAESRATAAVRRLQVVTVSGTAYERGLQHGRQCGDLIARYPALLAEVIADEARLRALAPTGPLPSPAELVARAAAFLPQLEAFAPHLIEELRGIAAGAERPFEEVLLVNVRAEVLGLNQPVDGCTAFAVGRGRTRDGTILAGQNLDQDPRNRELLIVLKVQPDTGPDMLLCTFAGLIGYIGVNTAGVAFFQNAVSTRAWRREGMPHYLLKRVLLEQDSLAACMAVLERARVCSSANYVLVDRTGLLDVELTPDGFRRIEPTAGMLVHGNHFLHPSLVPDDALLPALPDSPYRVARLRALIDGEDPLPELSTVREALSDHAGYPASVCRHEPGLASIASVIAEPDAGRLHVAAGNPCQQTHEVYTLA